LPASVIATDPAAATAIRAIGVQLRHHQASATTTSVVSMGRIFVLPMSVKKVIAASRAVVRCATIQSSSGWSMRARPSPSCTAWYVSSRVATRMVSTTAPTAAVRRLRPLATGSGAA
jgi:hypothetical protein